MQQYRIDRSGKPSYILWFIGEMVCRDVEAGVAQLARARAFQARCRGFESRFPLQGTEKVKFSYKADVAQSVERVLGKDEVTSSNLVIGSIFSNNLIQASQ